MPRSFAIQTTNFTVQEGRVRSELEAHSLGIGSRVRVSKTTRAQYVMKLRSRARGSAGDAMFVAGASYATRGRRGARQMSVPTDGLRATPRPPPAGDSRSLTPPHTASRRGAALNLDDR